MVKMLNKTLKESTTLLERDTLSVSEYNKLKIALNKNNSMKANFILHPGEVNAFNYKMRIPIYGAFRSFEKTKNAYHSYSNKDTLTNDQVTQKGVGIPLYNVYINLIDESITFNDVGYYGLDRYLKNYEQKLISDDSLRSGEIDLENLKASILEVAEKSKKDLSQALLSKNFIYNLSGKRKTKNSNSPEYNLDLESAVLKEDFDSSMPNWLMRAIKMNNYEHNKGNHKDLNYTMAFDTMKWKVEPFPEKGKLDNINDDEYIALLVDKSGDEHKGEYTVYFPSAYIGNNETIEINGRNRKIASMSLRALAPYVKEYAHTIDSFDSVIGVRNKQKDRGIAQSGSIDRKSKNYNWRSGDKLDKSGYIVDPNKYKRLLAQNKHTEYADRLNDLFIVLSDVRTKLKDFMAGDDVIPTPGEKDYSRDRNFNKGSRAYKEYSNSLNSYSNALSVLEKIKNGQRDYWSESFETFEQAVKSAEKYAVNCLNILENN